MSQVHSQFQVFTSDSNPSLADSFNKLKMEIERFTAKGDLAPKSIGVEYLEHTHQIVMSLGYTEGTEPGYTVRLTALDIGRFEPNDTKGIANAMSKAALTVENTICHEFYVSEDNEFTMILMSRI
jgi:hypothetical protein